MIPPNLRQHLFLDHCNPHAVKQFGETLVGFGYSQGKNNNGQDILPLIVVQPKDEGKVDAIYFVNGKLNHVRHFVPDANHSGFFGNPQTTYYTEIMRGAGYLESVQGASGKFERVEEDWSQVGGDHTNCWERDDVGRRHPMAPVSPEMLKRQYFGAAGMAHRFVTGLSDDLREKYADALQSAGMGIFA